MHGSVLYYIPFSSLFSNVSSILVTTRYVPFLFACNLICKYTRSHEFKCILEICCTTYTHIAFYCWNPWWHHPWGFALHCMLPRWHQSPKVCVICWMVIRLYRCTLPTIFEIVKCRNRSLSSNSHCWCAALSLVIAVLVLGPIGWCALRNNQHHLYLFKLMVVFVTTWNCK